MSIKTSFEAEAPRRHTVQAFLFAPGIAALVGAAASLATVASPSSHDLMGHSSGLLGSLGCSLFIAAAFALVGYPTAAILGVPVYLVLSERARTAFAVVVPLAGTIAAAPWILVVRPWQARTIELGILLVPFALGCVGGIAFLFIRRPRATVGEAAWDRREPLDAV